MMMLVPVSKFIEEGGSALSGQAPGEQFFLSPPPPPVLVHGGWESTNSGDAKYPYGILHVQGRRSVLPPAKGGDGVQLESSTSSPRRDSRSLPVQAQLWLKQQQPPQLVRKQSPPVALRCSQPVRRSGGLGHPASMALLSLLAVMGYHLASEQAPLSSACGTLARALSALLGTQPQVS